MAEPSDRNRLDEDEGSDEEEEVDDSGYKTVKDAVLFAIDISDSMLRKPPPSDSKKADRDSPASAALKCAYQLMQQRIISNPSDMMGVLLFGTRKTKFHDEHESSKVAYPHCYLLTDLDVPSASDVKRLRNLVEDEEESQELLVPSDEPVSMASVLFCANQIFATKAPNFSSRRLFLVTDNDDPHGGDKAARSSATVRAKDLYDLGVVIELFPISRQEHRFDREKFYDDIVYSTSISDLDAPAPLVPDNQELKSGDGISLLQSLLSSINSKATPRRAVFSLPFEIGPGLRISVKGYILLKRQQPRRTCYVDVSGEKPKLVQGKSAKIADDTGREVDKAEIVKAFKFGGETISFTKEDLAAIRNFGDPIIRIIGFKPLSYLPFWANTRSATFIYPSETDYIGSNRVFSALQQKLQRDQIMGLAWFIARRNATPVIAAIIPSEEELGERGEQIMPGGLWVVPLPFADDKRKNPETTVVRTTDDLTDKMRVVIEQLQLPKGVYDPKKYPNPSLQWFYKVLQAYALEEELPPEDTKSATDKTVPRYRQIDKRAGAHIISWGESLEEEHSGQRGTKRGSDGPDLKLAKRTKTSAPDAPIDEEMRRNFEKGSINKLTVAALKAWAEKKHLDTSGKKADLVDRIEDYFEHK
ncbi:putative DSB repair complex subunit Ku70 [Lineolata rhizophorae]|uniref:ATP-dependent DNA helicase II subunit 1 n=1 Tax=Lineolata rhizophorae TaxID=578093 RepID=A0A6A6NXS3_9PEZI|nr:putative DSB repair complex subunit Ku70 [Lineolata rhizophorae]